MAPSIVCPRHRILSRHFDESNRPLCVVCFREARAHADDRALEALIEQRIRGLHPAEALRIRLGWVG